MNVLINGSILFLKRYIAMRKDDEEVYRYGLEILYATVLGIISVIIIGNMLERKIASFIFLLCYCPLRLFAGGYHAKTRARCMLSFLFMFSIILGVNRIFNIFVMEYIHLAIALLFYNVVIFVFAPVESTKNLLSEDRKKRMKLKSIVISIIISTMIWLLNYSESEFFGIAFLTYTFSIFIILLGALNNKMQTKS
ncbi:MAG: accessory gene regulator B family protein [Anaerostipes sp.]|nr:accessory gene regulator B family protein [Anaerostipes sp.]